jgi:hypothetical protein
MLRLLQTTSLAGLLATAPGAALAKRAAPRPVLPLRAQGVEFSAPQDLGMAVVEARDLASGMPLWRRQIYTVVVDPSVEADVQACAITSIKAGKGCLLVENERGGRYALDLRTLEVRPLRGPAVLRWNRR